MTVSLTLTPADLALVAKLLAGYRMKTIELERLDALLDEYEKGLRR